MYEYIYTCVLNREEVAKWKLFQMMSFIVEIFVLVVNFIS